MPTHDLYGLFEFSFAIYNFGKMSHRGRRRTSGRMGGETEDEDSDVLDVAKRIKELRIPAGGPAHSLAMFRGVCFFTSQVSNAVSNVATAIV
jgi:hypothetical protein